MKKVSLMVSLLMIFLLVLGTAAQAQDVGMMEFCGDLSEADCNLLKESNAATTTLTAATTELDMNLSISNIPDAPFESLAFNLSGNGAFAIDPAMMETMLAAQTDPTKFADPAVSMALLSEMITGISGDLNLTLTIPAEVAAMAAGATEQPIPESLSVSVRLVDGFGYVNLDSLAAVLPPDAGIPPGWIGVDLATAMQLAMSQVDMMGGMDAMDTDAMEDYMGMFTDPTAFGEFLSVERLADTDVMGQAAAVFQFTFDYGAFFRSDMFTTMMQAQMDMMSSMSGDEISGDEMDEVMGMLGPMFDNLNLEITQTVGLDDKYVHDFTFHMDWDMAEFMAMVEPDAEGAAPVIVFDMTVHNGNFNDIPAITAPEDAMILPIEDMLGGSDM